MDAQANIAEVEYACLRIKFQELLVWVHISELTVLINSFGLLSAINPV